MAAGDVEVISNSTISTSAYFFDGVDDNITYPANICNFNMEFSLSFWINNNVGAGGADRTILSKKASLSSQIDAGYSVYFSVASVVFLIADAATRGFITFNYPTTGTWTHYTLVRTMTALNVYKNGVADASKVTNIDPTGVLSVGNAQLLHLGCGLALGVKNYFLNGRLHSLKFYNKALSATEAAAVYANTFSCSQCLKAEMKLRTDAIESVSNTEGTVTGAFAINRSATNEAAIKAIRNGANDKWLGVAVGRELNNLLVANIEEA